MGLFFSTLFYVQQGEGGGGRKEEDEAADWVGEGLAREGVSPSIL